MANKLGFVRKKLVTSQLQNALKTVRFKIFQNFFDDTFWDQKAASKRIFRNFESRAFSDHFHKPPKTPRECCFGRSV
jgi:hypothetical protein